MLRKAFALFLLFALLSGCSVLGNPSGSVVGGQSSTGDQESGGGVVSTEEALVGGGQSAPGDTAAQAQPAAPLALPGIEMQQLTPGGSFQRGGQTFRLNKVLIDLDATVIDVELQGLGSEYASAQQTAAPLLILPDGTQLKATGANGTGSPGSEKTTYTFPALPAGTTAFNLLIENQWSGALETWRIPVTLRN